MKLQKQLSRRVEGVEYPKYVLVIPPEEIKKLDWKAGTELKAIAKGGKLIVSPSQK